MAIRLSLFNCALSALHRLYNCRQPQNQNLLTEYRRLTHLKRRIRAPILRKKASRRHFDYQFNGMPLESHFLQGFPRVAPPILSSTMVAPCDRL